MHIDFALSSAQYVQVVITNMLGQEVGRMGNKILSPGLHSIEWSGKDKIGTDLQKGTYFYTLNAGLSKMSGIIVKE